MRDSLYFTEPDPPEKFPEMPVFKRSHDPVFLGGDRPVDLMSLINHGLLRSGPKHRRNRRERKWELEKSHRGTRRKWKRWPKYKWPGYTCFVNPETMEFMWMEP